MHVSILPLKQDLLRLRLADRVASGSGETETPVKREALAPPATVV
jgi:hypothetical protein